MEFETDLEQAVVTAVAEANGWNPRSGGYVDTSNGWVYVGAFYGGKVLSSNGWEATVRLDRTSPARTVTVTA